MWTLPARNSQVAIYICMPLYDSNGQSIYLNLSLKLHTLTTNCRKERKLSYEFGVNLMT